MSSTVTDERVERERERSSSELARGRRADAVSDAFDAGGGPRASLERLGSSIGNRRASRLLGRCACGGVVEPGGECAACRARRLALRHQARAPDVNAAVQVAVRRYGDGAALDPGVRRELEPALASDLGHVRVHTDSEAAEAAAALDARAFTLGADVFFAPGAYAPSTEAGRETLVHELAHVTRHRGSPDGRPVGVSHPGDREEVEAEQIAGDVVTGRPVAAARGGAPGATTIFRQPPVTGRPARAIGGEQGMGFTGYSQQQGWAFLAGPSGSGGHPYNAPGFDGVAFRTDGPFEMHILDNKSLARAGNVSSSSALTRNVGRNLDDMIALANQARFNDTPRIAQVRSSLRAARAAVSSGAPLPSEVHLVVTNSGGRSTGVTARLAGQGVEFRNLMGTPAGGAGGPGGMVPPGSAGGGGGGGGVAVRAAGEEMQGQARAIAQEAASSVRSELRLVRAARVVTTAANVLAFISALQTLFDFMGMSESALAGRGFVMTGEIARAEEIERSAVQMETDYAPQSDSIQTQGWRLFSAARDPMSAGRAATSLSNLSSDLQEIRRTLPDQIAWVERVQQEAESKYRRAMDILNSPTQSGAIAAATFGTAELARLFGASEDLQRIAGSMRRAADALRHFDQMLAADIEFLDSWFTLLFDTCERGGICSQGTMSIPFIGESHWHFLPGEEE